MTPVKGNTGPKGHRKLTMMQEEKTEQGEGPGLLIGLARLQTTLQAVVERGLTPVPGAPGLNET